MRNCREVHQHMTWQQEFSKRVFFSTLPTILPANAFILEPSFNVPHRLRLMPLPFSSWVGMQHHVTKKNCLREYFGSFQICTWLTGCNKHKTLLKEALIMFCSASVSFTWSQKRFHQLVQARSVLLRKLFHNCYIVSKSVILQRACQISCF